MIQIKVSPHVADMMHEMKTERVDQTVRSSTAAQSPGGRRAKSCGLLAPWLVVLFAFVFASATLLHSGAHTAAAHLPQDVAQASIDAGHDDCDQDREHGANGESCAALTVCKICVPVAETTGPRSASSIRHSWRGDSFAALSDAPHRKPPKLFVHA